MPRRFGSNQLVLLEKFLLNFNGRTADIGTHLMMLSRRNNLIPVHGVESTIVEGKLIIEFDARA